MTSGLSEPAATAEGAPGLWRHTAGSDALAGERVLDLSYGIAGSLCTKLLADAGAQVVKVESPHGDPLRRRGRDPSAGLAEGAAAEPLFDFLHQSKRSVVVDGGRPDAGDWILGAASRSQIVVWTPGSDVCGPAGVTPPLLRHAAPASVVCAITPFGLTGPWAGRPASDLTLQSWGGGVGFRGGLTGPPVCAGGQPSEWVTGTFAAVSVLTARLGTRITGAGELLDVSMLESVASACATTYPVTFKSIAGYAIGNPRIINIPGIHAARDGWIGFMVLTGQQWLDFCLLVDHPEWMEDESLLVGPNRLARHDEIVGGINAWVAQHTVEEIVSLASDLRVPAAPIGDGARTPEFEHMARQGYYEDEPRGRFRQPVPHFRTVPGPPRRPPRPAPNLAQHSDRMPDELGEDGVAQPVTGPKPSRRPLEGLRIVDLTQFWAGPVVGRYLALMGADVIRVESPRRPDGFRLLTPKGFDEDQWWEWAPMIHSCNVGKRHLGLDLSTPAGRQVLLRLLARADVVVENFTPRVLEAWDMGHRRLHAVNPRLVVVRMPAFGLDGPWRDRPGYAQTMEQLSGMAWTTGFPDGPPMMPNGQVDPLGGNLTLFALLTALEQRRLTGDGMLVECPLVLGALNLAAEPVLAYSATGTLIGRLGNRDRWWAPQGIYPTHAADEDGGDPGWVALSIRDDEEWKVLRQALGSPGWASDAALEEVEQRRSRHDEIDRHLSQWCAARTCDEVVALLWPRGIPVAPVLLPHEQAAVEQLTHRGFFEDVEHPVVGTHPHATWPVRFSHLEGRWHLRPVPTFGQHNQEILAGELGYTAEEVAEMQEAGIIGWRPRMGG